MSNSKEKAEELYWKYAEILYLLHDVRALKNSYAKKSALIAVDEILSDYKNYLMHENTEYKGLKYWQEVKKEIENL